MIIILVTSFSKNVRDHYIGNEISQIHDLQSLKYDMIQLDLTNAYLHAPIVDVVYIIIPEGFEGAGQIARLRKAAYLSLIHI